MKRSIFFPASLIAINLFLIVLCGGRALAGFSPELNMIMVVVNVVLVLVNFKSILLVRESNNIIARTEALRAWRNK